MTTSMGMTESAPFAIFVTSPHIRAGELGCPRPAWRSNSPNSGKLELRWGPEHHARLLAQPGRYAREAFDDEGFFCSGDAVQWSDRMTCTAASASTGASPRTSNSPPALSSASARCAARSSRPAVYAGRGDHWPRRGTKSAPC